MMETKVTYLEPVLGKEDPHGFDYRQLTMEHFQFLKTAAQITADRFGYPVYLVGSATYKTNPRDIDVSVIIPVEDYEKMFGQIPKTQDEFPQYLADVFNKSFEYISPIIFSLINTHHIDVKVCPDVWWTEKPKMILAKPINKGE